MEANYLNREPHSDSSPTAASKGLPEGGDPPLHPADGMAEGHFSRNYPNAPKNTAKTDICGPYLSLNNFVYLLKIQGKN
jgi:hypothetical protein